ncbi:MAG: nucleotidyltransferase domain-containing protein [Dehalococcoidia bacterium]|nr:nucleotidyltransferase domain-containing protein [Dehalococcoidia bacterium]
MVAPATAVAQRKAQLEEELARVVEVLVRVYQPTRIILFGSLAQDAVHEWSDIDLAVIKETDKRFLDRIGEVLELIQSTVGVEVSVYTPRELGHMVADGNRFVVEEILGRGRVVFERSSGRNPGAGGPRSKTWTATPSGCGRHPHKPRPCVGV